MTSHSIRRPRVIAVDQTGFWETSAMGGELRPELQATLFASDALPAGAQPWDATVKTTHATYMVNAYAFGTGYGDDAAIARAKEAEQLLGYRIRAINVTATTAGVVTAGIQNDGVAPFYYELRLRVTSMVAGCEGVEGEVVLPKRILPGEGNAVEAAVTLSTDGQVQVQEQEQDQGQDGSCFAQLSVSLVCPKCYAERPTMLANRGVDVTTGELVLDFGDVPGSPSPTPPPTPPAAPSPSPSPSLGTSGCAPAHVMRGTRVLLAGAAAAAYFANIC